jgi:hypothetical protein
MLEHVESLAVQLLTFHISFHRPPYILQPQAWSKVLPPPFLVAKGEALRRARQAEIRAGIMMHDDDDDADTHPYDDNDNHDGSILMMNQQQQKQNRQIISYDAGDSPMYDDGIDDDRTDEPFDQHHPHHHHAQPKSTTTDSYRSFEPPNAKHDPYERFSAPVTAPRTRGSSNYYSQPYEPALPPPSSSSMRHGGGRMEPPDGNDCNETDPVVFSRQHDHQHPQQRHLPQQQPHVRHAPPLHQIPLGSSSNYAPPPPSASSSPYSDYHHHDYRRPDPKVLHSSGMDPPEDEPPSLRKASMSASSSRYNNVGESSQQQHPITSAEESSDDQYTEPFAEPHESYEPVEEYYDNEGRMEYPEYEPLDFAEDSPVTAQSDYHHHHHYRQQHHQQAHHSYHHPVVVTSPTASDGDFTDPTIGTFSPRRGGGSGLPPTSPTRSQYSQNSALANEVLRRSSRTKQQPHHGPEYTNDALAPLSQPSASTWETDGTSEFSSVWTENEPDRTSRRALILQMAKARMKNNTSTTTAGSTATTGNGSGYGGKSSSSHYHQHEVEDEKKLGDVDLRGDLD